MENDKRIIKRWLYFFMAGLFVSGLTAMPVQAEINFLYKWTGDIACIQPWMLKLKRGIHTTAVNYPFLFYGYDWLAFAHFVLAVLFIGPLKDPVRNRWVIEFGMIACLLIIPFALTAGYFRSIPFWWRVVDCSFGITGLVPLGICLKKIKRLEISETKNRAYENTTF
jgi:DMSO/TMAO reductase YedYZ heme-binding membrane subunit